MKLTTDLPLLQSDENWLWTPATELGLDFWFGDDEFGTRWLVKMRGGFYALRERAFSTIAQAVGLSCQSSAYLMLAPNSQTLKAERNSSREQLALLYYPEHPMTDCGNACSLRDLDIALASNSADYSTLQNSDAKHAVDWARGEMLGYLCDMHEPQGRLFTPDHSLVLIDNEQMFSQGAADLLECRWLRRSDGSICESGMNAARALCAAVATLSDRAIEEAAKVPDGYRIEMSWDVPKKIRALRAKAKLFEHLLES